MTDIEPNSQHVFEQKARLNILTLQSTPEDHRVAKLAALAIGLHLMESVIPSPIPGVKPGISNIITLLVLYQYGWKNAVWVSLLRVLAGSLLLGQLFSVSFFLGLSGALFTLIVSYFAIRLPFYYFSPITVSVIAACAHILGQLILVRVWLIPNNGILHLAPILFLFSIFFGLINGLIVSKILSVDTHNWLGS